jgi:hypothetical protein
LGTASAAEPPGKADRFARRRIPAETGFGAVTFKLNVSIARPSPLKGAAPNRNLSLLPNLASDKLDEPFGFDSWVGKVREKLRRYLRNRGYIRIAWSAARLRAAIE